MPIASMIDLNRKEAKSRGRYAVVDDNRLAPREQAVISSAPPAVKRRNTRNRLAGALSETQNNAKPAPVEALDRG